MENLTSRVTELEAEVSTLDGAKNDAVARMESALASQAAAEARAKEAIAAEEETRARMAVSGLGDDRPRGLLAYFLPER